MVVQNKFFSLLGICMKAGKVQSGEVGSEAALKGKKAKLIIVAEDASENTKTKFLNSAKFYNVDLIEYGKKIDLGWAVGKAERSVMAIIDDGFAKKLKELSIS